MPKPCKKHKHNSYAEAYGHLHALKCSFDVVGITPYQCKRCGKWHIGRTRLGKYASVQRAIDQAISADNGEINKGGHTLG